MLNNPNPLFSEAGKCIHLTNVNLNHFKIIEATGLKIIISRSPWMESPIKPNLMKIYISVQKLFVGDTKIGKLIRLH
jgi:hypothetical protein